MGAEDIRRAFDNAENVPSIISKAMFQPKTSKPANEGQESDLAARARSYQKLIQSKFVEGGWTEGQRDDFEERAAIMQFDGGATRALAEFLAAGSVASDKC
jgi:hypothetical protein